jgi:hypothetical protein
MELGQTQSPVDLVPGSASEVRATAEAWKARSAEADRVRDDLATVDDAGTWKGAAYDAYLERFERQQGQFDAAVNGGTPARGFLDGEEILITKVETVILP